MTVQPAGRPRRQRSRWIVAALIAAALVAGVVGWQLHDRRGIRVGDRLDGVTVYSGQTTPDRQTVPIAFGVLSVAVGSGHEVGERGHRVVAPDGASLVEVSWSSSSIYLASPVWPRASAQDRRDPGADLTLVTGGRRYPIATGVTAADANASAVVVVRGDGSDARVESRVAGRVFRSSVGNFTPRTPRAEGFDGCDDSGEKTYSWVSCRLPVQRSGYVAGLGAAPAGKEWLVVSGATVTRSERRISRYGEGATHAEYLPSGPPKVSVTVHGVTAQPRVAGKDRAFGDAVRVADRAWLVDADRPSQVTLRYRLPAQLDQARSDWPDAPATREVDVSTTTTFPGA